MSGRDYNGMPDRSQWGVLLGAVGLIVMLFNFFGGFQGKESASKDIAGIETRLTGIDQRLASIDGRISQAQADIAAEVARGQERDRLIGLNDRTHSSGPRPSDYAFTNTRRHIITKEPPRTVSAIPAPPAPVREAEEEYHSRWPAGNDCPPFSPCGTSPIAPGVTDAVPSSIGSAGLKVGGVLGGAGIR